MTSRTDEVTLSMDTENLVAWGTELFYRSPTATTGPQTILRGSPAKRMHAVKDGHTIEAQDLHLIGADKYGNGQQVIAKGPGQIDLYDRSNPDSTLPSHAVWYDTLVSVKERDGDKMLDVLTLVGNASFVDEEHKQSLYGQRLQVWLFADKQPDDAQKKREAKLANSSKQKIHKIEAFDKVRAQSPHHDRPFGQSPGHHFQERAGCWRPVAGFFTRGRRSAQPCGGDKANVFQGTSQTSSGGTPVRHGSTQSRPAWQGIRRTKPNLDPNAGQTIASRSIFGPTTSSPM